MERELQPHNYKDLAEVTPEQQEKEEIEVDEYKDTNFPVRLHYVLDEMERDGMQHVASWQPHGRCFKVHSPRVFETQFLPL